MKLLYIKSLLWISFFCCVSGIDRHLLYSITQLPVKKFKEVPISVAIECWQWLLTNRPDLEYPVCPKIHTHSQNSMHEQSISWDRQFFVYIY